VWPDLGESIAFLAITGDVYRTVKQDEIREEYTKFSPLSTGN